MSLPKRAALHPPRLSIRRSIDMSSQRYCDTVPPLIMPLLTQIESLTEGGAQVQNETPAEHLHSDNPSQHSGHSIEVVKSTRPTRSGRTGASKGRDTYAGDGGDSGGHCVEWIVSIDAERDTCYGKDRVEPAWRGWGGQRRERRVTE